jgi:6-pyruvoyltetrahydropterin/6-carboxytetrahydropterin synthase
MSVPTCTRRLEFDSAHRVTRHESKCRHLHGHRYVVEVTAQAAELDACGRVVDFGVVKEKVGAWIDAAWDHGTLAAPWDTDLIALCEKNGWKVYPMPAEPTAENIAVELAKTADALLDDTGVRVVAVRVYETPNCWADWCAETNA